MLLWLKFWGTVGILNGIVMVFSEEQKETHAAVLQY